MFKLQSCLPENVLSTDAALCVLRKQNDTLCSLSSSMQQARKKE
jgi:hypothetical protein